MKAIWNNMVIADSDDTIVIEKNHYFPPDSVRMEVLSDSETKSVCPWKGNASYYDITVDGRINRDAAWYYPQPKEAAEHIKGYIAFWKGVEITGS
ncbi:MAG: DUF427 domain-containing protein [Bacteroidales bacterium]|nr:DUF427 domain-containing protein [Bacteroidales bacterium]